MNIAVLHFHRIGGSGIVAFEIAQQMVRRGHCIHFVGLEKPFRMMNKGENIHTEPCMYFHKVTVIEYPVFDYQPYALSLASQLAEIILTHDIQVIHSHYAIPHAVSAILARAMVSKKVRCITTLHGTDITVVGATPSMQRITKYSIEKSDHVVAVSQFLKKKTCKKFDLTDDQIEVLYNFIDEKSLRTNEFVHKPRIKEKIFVHASNLRSIKAPLDVIEIFYQVLKEMSEKEESELYQLWIVGDGPLKYSMVKRAKELEIDTQVRFWGEYSNINIFIEQANFFLFPSRGESFGLAALEAMSHGVPVVGLNMGGLREIIDDGVDGILFELNKVDIAVKQIKKLIIDHNRYIAMSHAAFLKVKNKFLSEKIIDRYEEIYRGV